MFTTKPEKNNALLRALLAMASGLPDAMAAMPNPRTKGRRVKTKKSRSKAKAHHIHGEHFKPVHTYEADGKPMSPSMFRHLHLGVQNPRKKNGPKSSH